MINRARHYAIHLCATCASVVAAGADVTGPSRLDAEIAALLAAQPRWSVSASLDGSFGHRDNLLLSAANEEESAFGRGVAELTLLRFPTGPFEYTFFARGEWTRYFQGVSVDQQANAWSQMEFARQTDSLRLALPLTAYHSDQVFDVSATEVDRTIAELKVTGAMAGPYLRWRFLPSWWLEAQASGEKKRYDDRANDGTVGEGAVRLGWIHSERFELRLSGSRRWRNFDRRARYNSVGREIAGTELKIAEQEVQLRSDLVLDRAKTWSSTTRLSLLHYRDNGSGYFNYREQRVDQEIEWRSGSWRARVNAAAGRIDFGVQRLGVGINPAARLKEEYSVGALVERKLSPPWTIFAAYEWERSRSNDRLAAYRVNEGLLGLRWGWEK